MAKPRYGNRDKVKDVRRLFAAEVSESLNENIVKEMLNNDLSMKKSLK